MRYREVSVLALMAAIAYPTAAAAQADPQDVGGDIIVTARKVAERIQDVPLSISAVTSDTIAARDSIRVSELAQAIPNVNFAGGALSTITVRGITSQARVNPGFDSGVGVYVDGVVQGKLYTFDTPLFDVDRVEFLRGPQGTLFGKNAIAGAISITTRNPSFTPTGSVELEYGSFEKKQVEAFVSTPITKTVAVSASGFRTDRNGYVLNLFDGRRFGNDDSYGGRAKILFKPSDAVQIVLAGDYLKENDLAYVQEITSGYGSPTGAYQTNVNTPTLAYRVVKGVTLTGDFQTNFGATLTSISAYRTAKSLRSNDTDVGPLDIVSSASGSRQQQFSQELRLSGKVGGTFRYLLGAYLFTQDTDNYSLSTFGPATGFGAIRGLTGNTFGTVDTDSIAFFGSFDWEFVPTLTATAGVRYTEEAKRLVYQQIGFPAIGAPNLPRESDSIDVSDVSPTFTLKFQPNRAIMVYATASKGFKSGGWNVDNITSSRITSFKALRFGDESVWNYEAGVKGGFLDGALSFSADVFQEDYTNIQTSQLVPVLGGGGAVVAIVTNAASARIRGFEAEVTAKPIRYLTLTGALGHTDAKYRTYTDGASNFRGNRLPGAPDWTGNLAANVRVPVTDDWQLGARGEYIYRSAFFGDRENTALRRTPASTLFNASTGVYGKHVDLVFFVNNLFDRRDITGVSTAGFAAPVGTGTNTLQTRQIGRTWGVRLAGRF